MRYFGPARTFLGTERAAPAPVLLSSDKYQIIQMNARVASRGESLVMMRVQRQQVLNSFPSLSQLRPAGSVLRFVRFFRDISHGARLFPSGNGTRFVSAGAAISQKRWLASEATHRLESAPRVINKFKDKRPGGGEARSWLAEEAHSARLSLSRAPFGSHPRLGRAAARNTPLTHSRGLAGESWRVRTRTCPPFAVL